MQMVRLLQNHGNNRSAIPLQLVHEPPAGFINIQYIDQ